MTLPPAIEASTPFLGLLGHIDYGHIVTVIIYLTRINVSIGGRVGFILFIFRKLYIGMPYGIGSGFIIWGALAPIVCGVLIHVIMVMGLRRGVCWIKGVLLLPYLLQHLCRSVLVLVLHVRDQVFVVFFQLRVEAILLHHFQLTWAKVAPMVLLQLDTNVCHSFIICLNGLVCTLFQSTHPGVQVPECDRNIIDTVHLFKDLRWSAVPPFITGAKVYVRLPLYQGQHGVLNLIIIVPFPEVFFHLPVPIGVHQCALLRGVPEQRQDHLTLTPVLFLLSIGGTPAPTLFAFPLVALLIPVSGVGSTGSVRIMTTRLISGVEAHRGIIIILGVVFWVLWVGLLSIVLEFGRLLCRVVVIWHGCPFRENGQSGCWTRGLLWFPPVLLGKIFICSADHASAPSYWIQGTFLTLLGHQIQILQPRLGRSQPFYGNPPVIFSGLCLISSRLLCSPLCDKNVSRTTGPQVRACYEVCMTD